jgi:hypothetical protein
MFNLSTHVVDGVQHPMLVAPIMLPLWQRRCKMHSACVS